jgi:hypothetical protein
MVPTPRARVVKLLGKFHLLQKSNLLHVKDAKLLPGAKFIV